ncbi:MAG: orotate phosphoribosyltransferase [Methanobacteriota archaeon]
MPPSSRLIRELVACGAVRFGDFTLASGAKSQYYVDIKMASTRPDILAEIGRLAAARIRDETRLAGMELGAVPIVVATALASGRPYVVLRKETKGHGTGKRIEGLHAAGERVLLLEDVATTGGSLAEGVKVLREAGLTVTRAVTVVDRDEGAVARLSADGVALESLVHARELLGARP